MSEYRTEHREGLKEELGWLKVIVVLAASLEFSLVGWLATTTGEPLLRGLTSFLSVIVGLMTMWMLRRATVIIRDLKGDDL